MAIPKNLSFSNYNKYPSDANPTTDAQMQVYLDNQNKLVNELAYMLWQPQTSYTAGRVVHSSSMPAGSQALVTVAGTTGASEPTWTAIGTTVTDGGVTYKMINIVTQISVTGSGNAVTSVTNNNGSVTMTKGSTFLTSHQDISGKADKVSVTSGTAGTSSATSGLSVSVPYVTINNQGLVTAYGTHTHTVSGGGVSFNASSNLTVTKSTQPRRDVFSTSNWQRNGNDGTETETGSGNITVTRYYFNTIAGINAGTYTLQNLLQQLVNKSHTHTSTSRVEKSNCNCDCNCYGDA